MHRKKYTLNSHIHNFRIVILHYSITFAIAIFAFMLCSCGNKVARVPIPVKVESEIDINTYSNFAVLPFVAQKSSSKIEDIPVEIGKEIAQILRSQLSRQKEFKIVDKQETDRLMTGEEIEEEKWLDDTERLRELGKYFEVKGIIVGSYLFHTDTRPRRYYGERYSYQQQRYVMDYQDYMQKTYLLSLRVMILDVDNGKTIWDESYLQRTAEAHSLGSLVFSQMAPKETTMRELSKRALAKFTQDISPHYEKEDRFLLR